MTRTCRGGMLVAWLAAFIPLLAGMRPAVAQRIADLPPPGVDPNNPAPTLVLSASVASLDAVTALVKDIGADVPELSADFIEQRMPFIGPGGLARNRPLGVLFYVGKDFDLERSLTFVLPVNDGKAELKAFLEKGAQPVAGRTDLVCLEGVGFRRTKDQFIFGQLTSAVAAVREDTLTATYVASPDVLARVDFDVGALKKALPDRYEAFVTEIDNDVDLKDPAARAGADLVTRIMRDVTRLGLSITRPAKDGGIRLRIRTEPFISEKDLSPAAAKLQRPGFPQGTTLFRADIAYPPAKALGRVTDLVTSVMARHAHFAKLSPAQQQQARALASGFASLLLTGEAGSLGVEAVDGQIVAHWVTQRPSAAMDLEGDMRALVQQANALAKSTGDPKPLLSCESYAAARLADAKVRRLILLHDGKPEWYLDAVARGATVFMSVAQTNGKFVERIVSLPPPGEATTRLSGWIDAGALSTLGFLPQAQGPSAIKGQHLTWTAAPDAGALRIDVDLPKSLLQQLPKFVQQLQ